MAIADQRSCQADAQGVIAIECARERALAGVETVSGDEVAPLAAARGRVTASAILSTHALPPFDQSAMDGYAVRTRDGARGLHCLPIVSRRAAGASASLISADGPAAVRIFTGARIPSGFDAVVMQEECSQADGRVTIRTWPKPGQHVRPAGDDMPAGAVIVDADTLVDARHCSILAASGVPNVHVRRRLRVGVLSTGDELRDPSEPLQGSEIHDSNRAMLLSLVQCNAIDATDLGRIEDKSDRIASVLQKAAREFDVLISSGGVSVGEEDHVHAAVELAGGSLEWLGTSIKPGKPVSVGRLGSANVIGLPGNPVAALVTFLWFARPILQRRMGLRPADPIVVAARAGFDELRKSSRDEFVPVVISGRSSDGYPVVEKRRRAGAARLSSLLGADGFARLPAGERRIVRGDPINLYPFAAAFSL